MTLYGEQDVDHLPWPMAPWIHKLYWCQADLHVVAVVKGVLHAPIKKYLWATSLLRYCGAGDDDPRLLINRAKTRVWFLREEGGFLRPPYDLDRGFGILTKWEDGPRLPARQRLGTLLLTPDAVTDSIEGYARDYLWDVGDMACDLLGKPECVRQFRDLAKARNPVMRKQACLFLTYQLQEDCVAK
jgi:hypothetical protein